MYISKLQHVLAFVNTFLDVTRKVKISYNLKQRTYVKTQNVL